MPVLSWSVELLVSDSLGFLSPSGMVTNNIQDSGCFLRDCSEQRPLLLLDGWYS